MKQEVIKRTDTKRTDTKQINTKQTDTKQKIIECALELFSSNGYDSVSVGEIAKAVGIKAPSLYNHFESKQAIFDAIVKSTAEQYERDTEQVNVHIGDADRDISEFGEITEEALVQKVRHIFNYSLDNEIVCRFRRMMTIEQFRTKELSELYTKRFVDRLVDYHSGIFKGLIAADIIVDKDPDTLALMYVSPIITLLGVCDRQPERKEECLKKLDSHIRLFFRTFSKN